jgi:hypothetical protein
LGNVLEFEMPFVEVDPGLIHISREHEIRQAIIVKVACRHAAAIVKVFVGEDIVIGGFDDPILKMDPRAVGGYQCKQLLALPYQGKKRQD